MTKRMMVLLTVIAVMTFAACKSEISGKTAADVSEPEATAAAAPTGEAVAVVKETSSITFVGRKVTRDHDGGFKDFDGNVTWTDGAPTGIDFTIDLNSVWTDTERLTGHLKSADFFDVEMFPTATFESTEIADAAEGNEDNATHMLTGNLDMHGMQKSVTFPARVEETESGLHATAEFTINRQDWNIAYPGKPDDLIKDEVLIKLDLNYPPSPITTEGGEPAAPETTEE